MLRLGICHSGCEGLRDIGKGKVKLEAGWRIPRLMVN